MTSTVNKDELMRWLESNLIRLHPAVEVRKSKSGGLGVYALEDLDPNDLLYMEDIDVEENQPDKDENDSSSEISVEEPSPSIMPLARIPKSSIFSAENSFLSNILSEKAIGGVEALILAFIYESELKEQSPWFGYFQSFDFNSLDLPPSLWPVKEKAWLKGSEVELLDILNNEEVFAVFSLCSDFAKSMEEELGLPIPPVLQNEGQIQTFAKISILISSRCFNIDSFHEFALVPAADLFNHSSSSCTCHFECTFEVCEICGLRDCEHIQQYGDSDSEDESIADEDLQDLEEQEETEDQDEDQNGESEKDQALEDIIAELDGQKTSDEVSETESDGDESEIEEQNGDLDYLKDLKHEDDAPIYSIECCDIVLHKKVSKGEEIFSTYGELNNPLLLLKYQFVELGNPIDYVSLASQIIKQKKLNLSKMGRRFKWWQEIGYEVFRQYMAQTQATEENEDDEDEDEDDESWLSNLKVLFPGNLSNSLIALVKLMTIKDSEFDRLFQPDPAPTNKRKKVNKKAQKHAQQQQLTDEEFQEQYYQKILKNLKNLMILDQQCYKLLQKVLTERFASLKQQGAIFSHFDNNIDSMKRFVELSLEKDNLETCERRKLLSAIIAVGEIDILTSCLDLVKLHL